MLDEPVAALGGIADLFLPHFRLQRSSRLLGVTRGTPWPSPKTVQFAA